MDCRIRVAGCVAVAGLGFGAMTQAHADVIVIDPAAVGRITDFADYGSNVVNSNSADTVTTGAGTSFGVSDHNSTNALNGRIQTPVIEYNIDLYRSEIIAAPSVLLRLTVTGVSGTPREVRVIGLDDVDANGVIAITDVEGGSSIDTFDPVGLQVNDVVAIDVTDYVKGAAANPSTDFIGFRLTFADLQDISTAPSMASPLAPSVPPRWRWKSCPSPERSGCWAWAGRCCCGPGGDNRLRDSPWRTVE